MDKLPIELVDIILSFAEYWPHVSSFFFTSRTIEMGLEILPPSGFEASQGFRQEPSRVAPDKDIQLIRTPPLGFPSEMSQPWLPSLSMNPARILYVEVKFRWAMPVQAVCQESDLA